VSGLFPFRRLRPQGSHADALCAPTGTTATSGGRAGRLSGRRRGDDRLHLVPVWWRHGGVRRQRAAQRPSRDFAGHGPENVGTGATGSTQRRRACVSLYLPGICYRSFRVAHRQRAMRLDMLPDQPPLCVGDVGAQDFWLVTDIIWQMHRNPKARCVAVEHTVKCDPTCMALFTGYGGPVELPYPAPDALGGPRPAYVDGIARVALRDDVYTRQLRQACPFCPIDRFGEVKPHDAPISERPRN